MAKRYDYTKIKKNKAGDRVYETTMYPTVNLDENDIYIYSKDGDRLDTMAYRFYKDTSLWWIIAKANNLDAAHIGLEVDNQIRIPTNIQSVIDKLKKMSY